MFGVRRKDWESREKGGSMHAESWTNMTNLIHAKFSGYMVNNIYYVDIYIYIYF